MAQSVNFVRRKVSQTTDYNILSWQQHLELYTDLFLFPLIQASAAQTRLPAFIYSLSKPLCTGWNSLGSSGQTGKAINRLSKYGSPARAATESPILWKLLLYLCQE